MFSFVKAAKRKSTAPEGGEAKKSKAPTTKPKGTYGVMAKYASDTVIM